METKLEIIKGDDPYQKALEQAMTKDEDGNVEVDSAGKPIFKDRIEWMTDSSQVLAIWTAIKASLDAGIVPPDEQDACFDLFELYAKEHRVSSKGYKISVPINYFVGTWHVLNSCRVFDLFKDDEPLDKAMDELTFWFAKKIDTYHEIKRKEDVEDSVRPEEVFKHSKVLANPYYPKVANIPFSVIDEDIS
jgi:hypothetical protein